MPNPTARESRVDQLLTDYAIAYGQDLKNFVGDEAATLVRKPKQSGLYAVWSKADMFRSEMKMVGNSSPAPEAGLRVTVDSTYHSDVYALKTFLADKDRVNSDLNIEKAKVRYLTQQGKLKRDKLFAAACFATGLWTSNTEQVGKSSGPGSNEFLQWNDESSTPIADIQTQVLAVELSTGRTPNVMVTNSKVAMALRRHPDMLDLFKHTSGGLVSLEQVAAVVGVGKILIGKAVENTGKELQSASMSRVFGNHALLAYVAPSMSEEEPTAITGFAWSEFDKVDATGAAIKRWRENDPEGDWLKIEQAIAYKITANDLGVFLKDAVA